MPADRKVEISDGGDSEKLPEDISREDLLSGEYKSNPRNKLIADFCKDMRLIENTARK